MLTAACSLTTALLCAVNVSHPLHLTIHVLTTFTEKDRDYNLLISRVAGLGKLHHRPIGFTGPLSQHLLGYNSIINSVRNILRDLMEVNTTHMFLGGYAKRDVDNLPALSMQ